MSVGYLRTIRLNPVIKEFANVVCKGDMELAHPHVFDWCLGIRPMEHFYILLFAAVISEIECIYAAGTHHRVPHRGYGDVFDTGILIFLQMNEDRRGAFGIQHDVSGILSG